MKKHLHNYKVNLKKNEYEEEFLHFLENENIDFEKIEYFPGYIIYKLKNIDSHMVEIIKNNSLVKRIEDVKSYYLNFQTKVLPEKELPKYNHPTDNKGVTVGIIDNGISGLKEFKDWIVTPEHKYCKEEISPTHGTFVAGVILYGDEISDSQWIMGEKLHLLDGCVVPDFDVKHLEEDELLRRIIKLVEDNRDIKIWNLAISIRHSVSPEYISDFGKVLDYLQGEFGVLICKSAGNGEFHGGVKQEKLMLHGADSARSLVVASCNSEKKISSFSLTGKGHKILLKPDVAMYGGDIYINEEGKKKAEPVYSFSPDGKIAISVGTSFATARVSSLVGNILKFKNDSSILFLKAILVLNTENSEKYYMGYGCIDNFTNIKKSMENIFVHEDKIENCEKRVMVPFSNNRLKMVLSSDLIIDYADDEEYIISDIAVKLPKEIEERNIYKEYNEFNSVKKYECEMDEEAGKIEVIIYRRWKNSQILEKKEKMKKYTDFCLISEK